MEDYRGKDLFVAYANGREFDRNPVLLTLINDVRKHCTQYRFDRSCIKLYKLSATSGRMFEMSTNML